MFAFHREQWLSHYHQRSNIESTFSSIKRKFGGYLRARQEVSMLNEVLTKVIAHNISMLVHFVHKHNVGAQLWPEVAA